MEAKVFTLEKDLIERIDSYLYHKKNYIFYDDYVDDEGNDAYRFFYSSSKDPLEFINIDIFKSNSLNITGKIHITTDKNFTALEGKCEYGYITITESFIRDKKKNKLELTITEKEFKNILTCLEYFECLL